MMKVADDHGRRALVAELANNPTDAGLLQPGIDEVNRSADGTEVTVARFFSPAAPAVDRSGREWGTTLPAAAMIRGLLHHAEVVPTRRLLSAQGRDVGRPTWLGQRQPMINQRSNWKPAAVRGSI
jgi:hypothetical protein